MQKAISLDGCFASDGAQGRVILLMFSKVLVFLPCFPINNKKRSAFCLFIVYCFSTSWAVYSLPVFFFSLFFLSFSFFFCISDPFLQGHQLFLSSSCASSICCRQQNNHRDCLIDENSRVLCLLRCVSLPQRLNLSLSFSLWIMSEPFESRCSLFIKLFRQALLENTQREGDGERRKSIKELNWLIKKNVGACQTDGNSALKHVLWSAMQRNAIWRRWAKVLNLLSTASFALLFWNYVIRLGRELSSRSASHIFVQPDLLLFDLIEQSYCQPLYSELGFVLFFFFFSRVY